eukprot:COSAG04_NODE_814_length_10091_cov_7.591873_9_plen_1027_part_00
MQAAEGNAGVIATQLCLEARYDTLTCLGGSATATVCEDDSNFADAVYSNPCSTYTVGSRNHDYCDQDVDANGRTAAAACPAACGSCTPQSSASPAGMLADLHAQACAMAESIGKGHSTDMLLSTTDVPPLSFTNYHQTFTTVQSYIDSLQRSYDTLGIRSDFHASLAQEVALGSADAADEAGIFQAKVDAADSRMQVYRTQIQGIDTTIQQTLQSMQLDGPALIESVSNQIASNKDSFQRATSAGGGSLQPEERSALQAQAADLQAQQQDIQRRLDGLGRRLQAGDDDRPQLEHRLGTVTQLLSWVQQRLSDADNAPAPSNPAPTCSAQCTGRVPPSSNGCGNDFTGQFHSWAMQALEDVTGCYSVPYLMNDMSSCCDAHDFCYGSCGVTQAFCDQQLRECMEAQASMPECQTTIDASGLAVELLGCDHFIAAQQESVAAPCRNTDQNQGCIGSCIERGACLETAERVCDTVGSIAGAVASYHVPVVSQAAETVQEIASIASYGLSVVDDAWDSVSSWFGRRLQDGCGDMDPATCQQMQDQRTRLQDKLRSAKRLIATVSTLATLNTQLLSQDEIDSASLAKLDMSFLDLDLLNDQVLVDSFSAALGDAAATYETEVRQLVTLIRSKLEQTRSYYEAALSKHDSEQRRDLLGRRAARASQLVEQEQDRAAQLAATRDFFDAKLRAYSHIGLQYVIQEARAYEYLFLQPYTGLDLDRLRGARMSGSEYQRFVAEAEADLQAAFSRTASQFNNGGSQSSGGLTFELADLPASQATFAQTGEITLSISLPVDSDYYGVTFSDVRVFLVGLPAAGRTPVTINMIKAGTSVFKDQRGDKFRFTHDETNPPLRFVYDADRCTPMSSSDGQLLSGNMEDIYIRYSPYGTWKLQVVGGSSLQLDAVTAIRFEFTLQAKPGRFAGAGSCCRARKLPLTPLLAQDVPCSSATGLRTWARLAPRPVAAADPGPRSLLHHHHHLHHHHRRSQTASSFRAAPTRSSPCTRSWSTKPAATSRPRLASPASPPPVASPART